MVEEYNAEKLAKKKIGKIKLIREALASPLEMLIVFMPSLGGYGLRRLYYRPRLKKMGKGTLIDVGVMITNPEVVSIDDYTWIDKYVSIEGLKGITIGRRVHVAPYSLIQGGGSVYIGDYVGISSFCQIYSSTEHYGTGKRMSGPMVSLKDRSVVVAPVVIEQDAFLGVGVTVMPGVKIGEGAVIGAHSLVLHDIPPWTIAVGTPAKPIKERPRIIK